MPDAGAPPPRRVLFLARHLGLGGATTHLRTLALGLQAAGVEVQIASRPVEIAADAVGLGPDWFTAAGLVHHPLPLPTPRSLRSLPADAARTGPALAAVVRRFRPDLLHVHWRSASLYARWVQARFGIPFVTTLHSQQIPSAPWHRALSFWGAGVICVSREAEAFLRRRFTRLPPLITTIPHGVDPTHFRPPEPAERAAARAHLGLPQDGPVLLLLGRLNPEKGVDLLLQALGELRRRGLSPPAVLAGEGDTAPLQALARRHGVADQVHFPGFTDARTALWAADVLVLPSRREGLPMAVVEAMHCGVVPVRTPAGGHHEQIRDGVTGFLVPFDDAAALTDRLAPLLTDEALRDRMARAARQHALAHFTVDAMTRRTLQLYRAALPAVAEPPRSSGR